MSHRPLIFVTGLAVGDYLLWNWSLNTSHDAIALVAGLTLPPLVVAFLWLAALSAARLVASTAIRPGARRRRAAATADALEREPEPTVAAAGGDPVRASSDAPSRRMAA